MDKIQFKTNSSFSVKLKDFLKGLIFWKGRKKGMVFTRNITSYDLKEIFFPTSFREKYMYLGSIPWKEDGDIFKAMYPLILAMDYEAKPKYCPRWVLRFLYVFGADKSIVRVRNRFYERLLTKLTKGIIMWDYKTKWTYYDLRISISAPKHLQNLAHDIERGFYSRGKQEELAQEIRKLDPNANITFGSVEHLTKQYNELIKKINE
jgi:hypothetical protein